MNETSASAKPIEDKIVVEKKNVSSSKKPKQANDPSLNMDELRELAELVIENGFTDFEFENENIRVRLSKLAGVPAVPETANQAVIAAHIASATDIAGVGPSIDADAGLYKITSPIVGTFYRSPGPDKDSYVTEGDTVTPETTVCIVEAMKLMNEIQAEVSGEVVKIYVENGQPVEYGQPLFGIRK